MIGFLKNIITTELLDTLHVRRKPQVIQMPITGRCNSMCVTCNVWKVKNNKDIDSIQLKKVLAQPFYSEVRTIGINGGELTLIKDIDPIIDAILSAKKLNYIHVISNGLLPERLFSLLLKLKEKANSKGVKVGLTLSVDGVGNIHEITRGIPNCFQRTIRILDEFKSNQNKYCDSFNIGCTISQTNVPYCQQTYEFLSKYPFKVYYHLAVPNKRIHTFDDANYYVINNERNRLLALEFFQYLYSTLSLRKEPIEKFRVFSNYYFLKNGGKGRLAQCYYKYRDVTIDENLDLSLCATASNIIGSLYKYDSNSLIKSKECKRVRKEICKDCNYCIHYSDIPTIKGLFIFFKYILKDRFLSGRQYK